MTTIDARGNLHGGMDGRFAQKPRTAAAGALEQPVAGDVRSACDAAAAALEALHVEEQRLTEQAIRHTLPAATSYQFAFEDEADGQGSPAGYLVGVYDESGVDLLDALGEDRAQWLREEVSVHLGAQGRGVRDDAGRPVGFDDPSDWKQPADRIDLGSFTPGPRDYVAHRGFAAARAIEAEVHRVGVAHGVELGRVTILPADPDDTVLSGQNRGSLHVRIDRIEDADGVELYDASRPVANLASDDLRSDLEVTLDDANLHLNDGFHELAPAVRAAQELGAEGFTPTRTPLDLMDLRFRAQRGYDGNTLFGSDYIYADALEVG